MIIILVFLFWVHTVITDPIGTRTEVNSSVLQSRIQHGFPSLLGEERYMASLQVNHKHICSSGIISARHLLSTAECVIHIEDNGGPKFANASAVFGNINLFYGIKHKILLVKTHSLFDSSSSMPANHDVGLVLLVNHIKSSSIHPLELFPDFIQVRSISRPRLCGWGSTEVAEKECSLGTDLHSNILNCMDIRLRGALICGNVYKYGDFSTSQTCGENKDPSEAASLGDIGSPLVAIIHTQYYIVGVTTRQIGDEKGGFTRFVRASAVHETINLMKKWLLNQPREALRKVGKSSGRDNFEEAPQNGDIGSPLMMTTHDTNSEQNCMAGITLQPYKSDTGRILRFIRTDRVHIHIKRMKDMLELSKSKNISADSSTQLDLTKEQK